MRERKKGRQSFSQTDKETDIVIKRKEGDIQIKPQSEKVLLPVAN